MGTKYKVLEQSSKDHLTKLVDKHLSEGWELQGGVSFSAHPRYQGGAPYEVGYLQAIVKID